MFKQIQNYINFLIVCLIASNLCFALEGCTDDLEAYNCANDDVWSNYIFDIGGTMYDNSCNWDWNLDTEEADYVGGCVEGICQEILWWEDTEAGDGYYNPEAQEDDGSCRYPQAPHDYEVVFNINVTSDTINVNWSAFTPPTNATLVSYHVQRCLDDGCAWIPGFTLGDVNTETFLPDEYEFEVNVEIKYAIAVQYSNNPYWGWAIGASYIMPPELGNINGDGFWNVLDIVALANCVLTSTCDDMEFSYACDMNGDGTWNVLDIVALANCVLTSNCGQ